jgi:phenylacetate-CoA ligase
MGLIRVLAKKMKLDAMVRKSRIEIEAVQQENFRSMLNYAISHSPFYRELYQGRGVEELLKDGIPSLPIIDKQIGMDNFDSLVTTPKLTKRGLEEHLANTKMGEKYKGEFQVIHTSGSSGKIGIFAYDSDGWDALRAQFLARRNKYSPWIKRTRLAFMGTTNGHYGAVTLISSRPRFMGDLVECSINEPLKDVVERLNRFKPDDIRSYPSGLTMLAVEQLAGRLKVAPKNIISCAEPLDEHTKRLIIEAFGIMPYNSYGASESLCIARDCPEHNGLHILADQNLIEIVDKEGMPVEPGKSGEMVVTNLYNRCQPLIRYNLHDISAYSDQECDCKSPFPLIKSIEGRTDDMIWVEDGHGGYETVHPFLFIDIFIPGLRRLQVHQLERNRLSILAVVEGDEEEAVAAISAKVREILSGKGLLDLVEFDVNLVDSILPDPKSGKTKTVISRVGAPKV